MVDYSKKTVAELTEILKSRSLPHSGKKAELVARLNEADKSAEETGEFELRFLYIWVEVPKLHLVSLRICTKYFPHRTDIVALRSRCSNLSRSN